MIYWWYIWLLTWWSIQWRVWWSIRWSIWWWWWSLPSHRPPSSSSSCRPRRRTLGPSQTGRVWSGHHHDFSHISIFSSSRSQYFRNILNWHSPHLQGIWRDESSSHWSVVPAVLPSQLVHPSLPHRHRHHHHHCHRHHSSSILKKPSRLWNLNITHNNHHCDHNDPNDEKPSSSCHALWRGRRQFPPWKVLPSWGRPDLRILIMLSLIRMMMLMMEVKLMMTMLKIKVMLMMMMDTCLVPLFVSFSLTNSLLTTQPFPEFRQL